MYVIMLEEEYIENIKSLVSSKDEDTLKNILSDLPITDVFEFFENFDIDEQAYIFPLFKNMSEIFLELKPDLQAELLSVFEDSFISRLLENMEIDDRTYVFENLDETLSSRLFNLLDDDGKKTLNHLLSYPAHSVGRLMRTDYLVMDSSTTVATALRKIKTLGDDTELSSIIYVVAKDNTLQAVVTFRSLFFSPPSKKIAAIMDSTVISAKAFDDEGVAVSLIRKYNFNTLPVVDAQNKMLGIVSVDDIMDIALEEHTETFHKIAGITHKSNEYDENIKYASVSFLYKKRIPWLITLVFVNIFSASIILFFQSTIDKYIILVAYIPILIGSAGNAGSQSAIIAIRGLSSGAINLTDWLSMFLKELVVSLLLGLSMALALSLITIYRSDYLLVVIISISMVFTVMFGSVIGISLPFIFRKINIDPAISSTPLVSSLCDIVGVSLYLSIARLILRHFI